MNFRRRLDAAILKARRELLSARNARGYWEGQLSASALSTATAVTALAVADRNGAPTLVSDQSLIARGLDWLARNDNADGGWGDTIRSHSNLSTSTLCWAAFGVAPDAAREHSAVIARAEQWITGRAGSLEQERLARAIIARYGKDRTFSVPILTMCALAGRLGSGASAWANVIPLPFELAALPQSWFAALRLPVVSYALPALIAIGQARHYHHPSRNPLARWFRNRAHDPTLRVLDRIQPPNGGFLEATPLTSFVTMSLAASGQAGHPVTERCLSFLRTSVRTDGSWPIDTNLATWVTTLSVNALIRESSNESSVLGADERHAILDWLLRQQYRIVHPYTGAKPGGWAWTDLPGGVPDADDTAGALVALARLGEPTGPTLEAAIAGVNWLLGLQNSDGGIPTFCRGWGALPFDRSSPDLTAHALRAWTAWLDVLPQPLQRRVRKALERAVHYLERTQRSDGGWIPLWFGNQFEMNGENPTYGTAKVVFALTELLRLGFSVNERLILQGGDWLLRAQGSDGSWGGFASGPPSTEETALAVEALSHVLLFGAKAGAVNADKLRDAVERGAMWLVVRVESGKWAEPAPIGFYFAKLWYYEHHYPMIFTVGALEGAANALAPQ